MAWVINLRKESHREGKQLEGGAPFFARKTGSLRERGTGRPAAWGSDDDLLVREEKVAMLRPRSLKESRRRGGGLGRGVGKKNRSMKTTSLKTD